MAISVDPRRLGLLKELAAAEGLRPGQLVQRWVEERLDAERTGAALAVPAAAADGRLTELETVVATLGARLDELAARLASTEAPAGPAAGSPAAAAPSSEPRRPRGRPRKAGAEAEAKPATRARSATRKARPTRPRRTSGSEPRIALHDEIASVIEERGPSTAAELATAIRERGRYRAPRSARPLDAATVNSRVSNPIYRKRFSRSNGKISLAAS